MFGVHMAVVSGNEVHYVLNPKPSAGPSDRNSFAKPRVTSPIPYTQPGCFFHIRLSTIPGLPQVKSPEARVSLSYL
jgi:hypothetical protein